MVRAAGVIAAARDVVELVDGNLLGGLLLHGVDECLGILGTNLLAGLGSKLDDLVNRCGAGNLRAELGKLGGIDAGNEFLDINSHDGSLYVGAKRKVSIAPLTAAFVAHCSDDC